MAFLRSSFVRLWALREVLLLFVEILKWFRWQMLVQKCFWTKFKIISPWTLVHHYEFAWMLPAIPPSQLTLYRCFGPLKDAVGRWKEVAHSSAVYQCTSLRLWRSFLWVRSCWSVCSLLVSNEHPTLKTNFACETRTITRLLITGVVVCQRLCKVSKLGLWRATMLIIRCFLLSQVTETPLVHCKKK